MPKLTPEFKSLVQDLSIKEKERIIFAFARSSEEIFKKIRYKYLGDLTKDELEEEIKEKIEELFEQLSERSNPQRQLASRIKRAIRKINEFKKITKNLLSYINLHIFLLNIIFNKYSEFLGTKYTTYDTKVIITVQKTLKLITQTHEDYWLDYEDDFNQYFKILHQKCPHHKRVQTLPRKFEIYG